MIDAVLVKVFVGLDGTESTWKREQKFPIVPFAGLALYTLPGGDPDEIEFVAIAMDGTLLCVMPTDDWTGCDGDFADDDEWTNQVNYRLEGWIKASDHGLGLGWIGAVHP